MMTKYGLNCRLLFTDTDSFCYHVVTEDLYKDMMSFAHELDTSSYPKDSEHLSLRALYSPKNSKILGKFKDECNGTAPWSLSDFGLKCTPCCCRRIGRKSPRRESRNRTCRSMWRTTCFDTPWKIRPVPQHNFYPSDPETTPSKPSKITKFAFPHTTISDIYLSMAEIPSPTDITKYLRHATQCK